MIRSREELAWLAGFWDGEGYVYQSRTGGCTHYPVFGLSQAGEEGEALCKRVAEVCGVGAVVRGPFYNKKFAHYKPQFKVNVYGYEKVQALVAMCWPWLSETKRAQATVALMESRTMNNFRKKKDHCVRGHAYTPDNTYIYAGARRCRKCRWKTVPPPDASFYRIPSRNKPAA